MAGRVLSVARDALTPEAASRAARRTPTVHSVGSDDPARLRLWLERGELEGGSGYRLRDAATGDALGWNDPRLAAAGAHVVRVAGTSYRGDALQDEAFRKRVRAVLQACHVLFQGCVDEV